MTVAEAIHRLEELHSGDDPIRYKRQDTTPSRLAGICNESHASAVRVVFRGESRERRGTLLDMVRDRQALQGTG